MELADILQKIQFSLGKEEKSKLMVSLLREINSLHLKNSSIYNSICNTIFPTKIDVQNLSDLPFLPVSVFKNHTLKSISDDKIFKVLTSSGTTGQMFSKIYLDKETAQLQTLALSKIISHLVGPSRLPMLIIDSKSIFSNKSSYSARGAGILGLSVYGKDHTYILDENFNLDENLLKNFLEKYSGQKILIFGFTFMVWKYLVNSNQNYKYDLNEAILLHSGGWKKLIDLSVSNEKFKEVLKEKFNLKQVINFYGMVEQVGAVFVENSDGYLHCPNFADVIIRNPVDFSVQKPGKPGLIQVISPLPKSYPGHSLLTEDIGILMGEDDASNGWKGKYFKILGRAKNAELRGCSDTFKSK